MSLSSGEFLVDKFISIYFQHLKIHTYSELLDFVSNKKEECRNRLSNPNKKLSLKSGDFIKSLALEFFGSVLSNGFPGNMLVQVLRLIPLP